MNTISHPKIQRIGITYESIILFLIPAIQSIPILFNTDREGTFDSWKLFIFFGFAIFGFNFLIHLMLALLRNHKRSELLQRLLRMIIWSLLIVNTVENQIIYLSSVQDEAAMDLNTQKIILLCSCVGVFAYAIINHHTTPSEREKKLAVCATIIYFSLRLSIDLYDPSLAILGGLLCAILVRVFYLITKTKLSDPAKQAVKDVENFLLKLILSDTEDAFVVLQNNHNVLYSNPKSLDFLQTTSGNLLDGLRELKNLDALSTEEQVKVKDQLFESMLGEGEENEGPGGRTPKFSSNDMNFGKTARNMTSPRDTQSHLTREHTLLNSPMGKPDKSFFSMKSRPRHQSFMSINSSKFKPVSPLLGPKAANKLKSLPLKSFKTGENESKTQSEVFSYANVGEDNIQASHFKRSISRKESNLTHSTTKKDFSLKRLFSKRESLLKEGKSQNILPKDFEIDEEKIFKAGIPRNLKTLFNYMEMTQVPSIDFPFTIDQVVNNLCKILLFK